MYTESQKARRALFGSRRFSEAVAGAIELDGARIANACAALVATGLVPCASLRNMDALATEGAMSLMAIGGRQSQPDAIVRVLGRLGNMTHQVVVGSGKPTWSQAGTNGTAPELFAHGLENVLKQTWRSIREPIPGRTAVMGVSMFWGDERGGVLYGVIDHLTDGRKHIYSSAPLRIPQEIAAEWDFVQLPTVGGSIFSPLSILRYAALLDDGVAGTAAELEDR
jgi:hypothetical protein